MGWFSLILRALPARIAVPHALLSLRPTSLSIAILPLHLSPPRSQEKLLPTKFCSLFRSLNFDLECGLRISRDVLLLAFTSYESTCIWFHFVTFYLYFLALLIFPCLSGAAAGNCTSSWWTCELSSSLFAFIFGPCLFPLCLHSEVVCPWIGFEVQISPFSENVSYNMNLELENKDIRKIMYWNPGELLNLEVGQSAV